MQLFVEQLTVIDSAYVDAQHGMVGESWICDVALHGDMDDISMIMDFGHVKKQLKQAIDASLDHVLLIPRQMPGVSRNNAGWHWKDAQGRAWQYQAPECAQCLLDVPDITTQALEQYLEAYLMQVVPDNVQAIDVTLRHEIIEGAFYHYVHGLKKHDGNCQRIAHGHRSKISVKHNGEYSEKLTQEAAQSMRYRYVVSREDIICESAETLHTAYDAPQGHFSMHIPAAVSHSIDSDSTVECIAKHLAERLQAQHGGEVTVRACEGVQKGAQYTAR